MDTNDTSAGGVQPRYDDSISFLRRWAPGGPWVLTAIEIEPRPGEKQPRTHTRTFTASEEVALRAWLTERGATDNIYFAVNPLLRPVAKKAEREDVAALAWLHTDIDPRADEDIATEQQRALRLLQSPPGAVPPPTGIVFSGGGYQGFWKLREPVPINGEEVRYQDAKLYNLQLEVLFGADHCHNVDRIMRLPGTVNRPTAKKRAKGRKEALAEVVEWHEDRVYDIGQFAKAPAAPALAGNAPAAHVAQVDAAAVRRFRDANSISDRLPGKARVIIAQGIDPDEPNKFGGSRSEWLLFACCAMVRAGCTDQDIYSVITDSAFGVSASVLDKGSATEDYARRQIEQARDKVGSEPPRVRLPGGSHQHADTARELAPLMRRRGWCRRGRAVFTLEPGGYLEAVRHHRAVTEFEAVATFYRVSLDKKTGVYEDVPDKITSEVARIIMESADIFAALPEVRVVHETPVLLFRGGELSPIVGFDEESGILARGEAPPDVSFTDARSMLSDLLCDWRFRDEADHARAIAALLKPALNASGVLGTGRVPMDVVEADKSQAGKGLLCRIIAAVYRARAATVAQSNGGVGSVRESIAKNLLEGRPFIQLDNWRGALNEPFLEAALTEPQVECRAPHKGGAVVDPSGTCFLMTSNGAELTEDLANRCNVVRIVKQPEGYQFCVWPEGGIEEHVAAN